MIPVFQFCFNLTKIRGCQILMYVRISTILAQKYQDREQKHYSSSGSEQGTALMQGCEKSPALKPC